MPEHHASGTEAWPFAASMARWLAATPPSATASSDIAILTSIFARKRNRHAPWPANQSRGDHQHHQTRERAGAPKSSAARCWRRRSSERYHRPWPSNNIYAACIGGNSATELQALKLKLWRELLVAVSSACRGWPRRSAAAVISGVSASYCAAPPSASARRAACVVTRRREAHLPSRASNRRMPPSPMASGGHLPPRPAPRRLEGASAVRHRRPAALGRADYAANGGVTITYRCCCWRRAAAWRAVGGGAARRDRWQWQPAISIRAAAEAGVLILVTSCGAKYLRVARPGVAIYARRWPSNFYF